MKKRKIVVTGGAGFVGSHVVKLLCDRGYAVVVVDDLSLGFRKFVDPRAKLIIGSVGNGTLMKKVLKDAICVVHMAASSIIKFSFEDPAGYFRNNVTNGIVLLDAMRARKVPQIIFSSTAAVYGMPLRKKVKETDETNPINPYGASKLAFENALKAYYHAFGIESVSFRYFNCYGPHDEQKPASRAVPMWIEAILSNKVIPIYWNGRQKRDYVFVEDIARAHMAAIGKRGCYTYNLGNGRGVIMSDILKKLRKISGKKLVIKNIGKRPGDPPVLVADISKVKKELGWKPTVGLEEGLKKTFEYYKTRKRHGL